MELIRMSQGRLIVPDGAVVGLPKDLSVEFLDAVFGAGMEDDGHVHRIHRKLPWAEKTRFEKACRGFGEEYEALWAQAAISWASILNETNRWDSKMFNWCYSERIGSWLVEDVVLTETGIWFATSRDETLMTMDDFLFEYGITFKEHLEKVVSYTAAHCQDVLAHMADSLITKQVVLGYPDGSIGMAVRVGPSRVPPRHWTYSPGETFLDEYDPTA